MHRLLQLSVEGYKSIASQTLDLGRLNVLIGGNGVGKSNLLSVFSLLRAMDDGQEELEKFVSTAGGANAILHFGRKRTERIRVHVVSGKEGSPNSTHNTYQAELTPTDVDDFHYSAGGMIGGPHDPAIGSAGHQDDVSIGRREAVPPRQNRALEALLHESGREYHFHDTSREAAIKQTGNIDDNRHLRPDGSNLAAFLYWMKLTHTEHLRLIVDTIRQIAPFFEDFELAPRRLNEQTIRLEWRERGSDSYFNANQLSDGTLRFICLATLLLQPVLPRLIRLDEPELGLHPAAIQLLSDLLKQASERTQLLVSTQSVTLVNHLEQAHVWVADRQGGATVFTHLATQDLSQWLGAYALGELWEKNVLGGRP
jgi:predicted ATPase